MGCRWMLLLLSLSLLNLPQAQAMGKRPVVAGIQAAREVQGFGSLSSRDAVVCEGGDYIVATRGRPGEEAPLIAILVNKTTGKMKLLDQAYTESHTHGIHLRMSAFSSVERLLEDIRYNERLERRHGGPVMEYEKLLPRQRDAFRVSDLEQSKKIAQVLRRLVSEVPVTDADIELVTDYGTRATQATISLTGADRRRTSFRGMCLTTEWARLSETIRKEYSQQLRDSQFVLELHKLVDNEISLKSEGGCNRRLVDVIFNRPFTEVVSDPDDVQLKETQRKLAEQCVADLQARKDELARKHFQQK